MSLETKINNPNTDDSQQLTPYQAYDLMVEDYDQTRSGEVIPVSLQEFGEEDVTETERLMELRHTLGQFGLLELGLPIEKVASDLGMDAMVLANELEVDERLINVTQEYKKRFESPEEVKQKYISVKNEDFKWMTKPESVGLISEVVETDELNYRFVDLTPLHRTTEDAKDRLEEEGVLDNVMSIIRNIEVPKLMKAVMDGDFQEFRPVKYIKGTKDKDRRVRTTMSAYKFGVHGPQNRVIVVMMGNSEIDGLPQFGLVSVCDHEDQEKVLRALSQDNTVK